MYLKNENKVRLVFPSTFHQNVWVKYGELMMHGNDETGLITKT
jgi:hypothetical protein